MDYIVRQTGRVASRYLAMMLLSYFMYSDVHNVQNTRLYRKRRQRCTEITKREMLGKWKMTEIR